MSGPTLPYLATLYLPVTWPQSSETGAVVREDDSGMFVVTSMDGLLYQIQYAGEEQVMVTADTGTTLTLTTLPGIVPSATVVVHGAWATDGIHTP
jgi:hypothetical protein